MGRGGRVDRPARSGAEAVADPPAPPRAADRPPAELREPVRRSWNALRRRWVRPRASDRARSRSPPRRRPSAGAATRSRSPSRSCASYWPMSTRMTIRSCSPATRTVRCCGSTASPRSLDAAHEIHLEPGAVWSEPAAGHERDGNRARGRASDSDLLRRAPGRAGPRLDVQRRAGPRSAHRRAARRNRSLRRDRNRAPALACACHRRRAGWSRPSSPGLEWPTAGRRRQTARRDRCGSGRSGGGARVVDVGGGPGRAQPAAQRAGRAHGPSPRPRRSAAGAASSMGPPAWP